MNITDFSLKLNGFPLKKAKTLVKQIQSFDVNSHRDFIENKKKEIVSFHLDNNPFYKGLVNSSVHWEELPILIKQDLQIPLKERLSSGYKPNNCYVNKTSGSSGHPFYFAKDKFSHAMTWAVFDEWYNWYKVYSKKQARFYGIPVEKKPRIKERLKDAFSNRFRFDVFDLSEEVFNSWLQIFKKKRFEFITGYTSVIVSFAQNLKSKNIVLKDICPSLMVCFPTSEMCSKEEKQLISETFGIPIAREYGAAEFGLIALEKKGKWILNDVNLYVEVLDDQNNVLPYGEEGRIIITDLFNKAHPFIRYDIGDIGAINEVDGVAILEKIIGRKEDYVALPNGGKAPGLALYYVTKSVMEDSGDIKEIKVVQTKIDQLEIHYVSKVNLDHNQKNDIQLAVTNYLGTNIDLNFIRKEVIERSGRGKLKQFSSFIEKG
ncbi:phenylacetate--CoA ligase family protein [Flavobacteriaceae sp. LMIT009]